MDPHFIADSLSHHISLHGFTALCAFVTSKKFQMIFWMITGSDLFSVAVMLPHSVTPTLFFGNNNFGVVLKI